jgi:NitT/TauT family transport system permease protein
MFVALITMAFLGYIFSYLLDVAEKIVIPWANNRR